MYKNLFNIAMLLIVSGLVVFGADAGFVGIPSDLPSDAAAMIEKSSKVVAEAEAKALTAKYVAYSSLVDKLEEAQERATKAGKLDAAMAIKGKLTEYRQTIADIVALRKPTGPTADQAIGSYRVETSQWSGVWVLKKGGQCGGVGGTWTMDPVGKVTIKWSNGLTEYILPDGGCTLASGVTGTAVKL